MKRALVLLLIVVFLTGICLTGCASEEEIIEQANAKRDEWIQATSALRVPEMDGVEAINITSYNDKCAVWAAYPTVDGKGSISSEIESFINATINDFISASSLKAEEENGYQGNMVITYEPFKYEDKVFSVKFDVKKDDVSTNYKDNQIVVISANSGFPLRFLANVKVCKEKYDALVTPQNGKCALNRMVLHTESFKEDLLPEIFEEGAEPRKQKMVKPLMLAYALGIVKEQQDPTTGAKFDAIRIPDETFGDQWKPMGKGFADSWEAVAQDFKLAQLLKNQVAKEMAVQARSNDQKAVLRKALGELVQTKILPSPLCENNQFNPNYTKFRNLAVEIVQSELQDL